MKLIHEIATKKIITLEAHASIKEALQSISKNRIHNILIRDGLSYRILSMREILKTLFEGCSVDQEISILKQTKLKTIRERASVMEASKMMQTGDALLGVIDSKGRVTGVLSPKDIKDATKSRAKELLNVSVGSIMGLQSAAVMDHKEKLTLKSLHMLNDSPTKSLILTKEGKAFGIITQRDIAHYLAQGRELNGRADVYATRPLLTVTADTSVNTALSVMQIKYHRRLVVIDASGALLGVVTQKEILDTIYAHLAQNTMVSHTDFKELFSEVLKNKEKELSRKLKAEIEANRKRDQMLFEEERQAAMSELISMIAHQWRQPLSALTALTAGLRVKMALGEVDEAYLQKKFQDIDDYAVDMSRTIDDFRGFYSYREHEERKSLVQLLDHTVTLFEALFSSHDVELVKEYEIAAREYCCNSELIQVFTSLFKNALDAFKKHDIKSPKITIHCKEDQGGNVVVSIRDNAGGIDAPIKDRIFDPYFSTKEEKNGSGIGLYSSKIIVEKHCRGSIEMIDHHDGAEFMLWLPPREALGEPEVDILLSDNAHQI